MGRRNLLVLSVLALPAALTLAGCSDRRQDVELVRSGCLPAHPNVPVGEAIDRILSNPRWEAVTDQHGNRCVTVRGEALYRDKKSRVLIRFLVNRREGTFKDVALEVDGVRQSPLDRSMFLDRLFKRPGDDAVPGEHAPGETPG